MTTENLKGLLIRSGKINPKVTIELPDQDEEGNFIKTKVEVNVKPISNRTAERLNDTYKDKQDELALAIIAEAIPELTFSIEEFKQLGTGIAGTLVNKINEVSGLDRDYIRKVKDFQ